MQIFAKPCGSTGDDYFLIGSIPNRRSYIWSIPTNLQGEFEFVLMDCDGNEYPFEGCLTIADFSVDIFPVKEDCGIYSFSAVINGTDADVVSYEWSFGEHLVSSSSTPTQDFPAAGVYRICVEIVTEENCKIQECIDLDISEGVEDDCNYCPPNVLSEVEGGDLFIEDDCYGVIMQSPNGSCFRVTVTDEGQVVAEPVECP